MEDAHSQVEPESLQEGKVLFCLLSVEKSWRKYDFERKSQISKAGNFFLEFGIYKYINDSENTQ